MTRTLNRLSALKVEKAKAPGMYADGGGLYLRVAEGGSKQWIFRYVTNGRARDMGIGPVRVFTLAEARERAREASKLRYNGLDPIAHKHAQRAAAAVAAAGAMTFRHCAEGFIKDNERGWTNAKHRHDWHASLKMYVYPVIGNLPVASIDTPLVLKVIKSLWERVPETASRVRGRIENVLGWATVHHYRSGDNPARWSQHLEHVLPARSEVARVEHHAALPYPEVPAFLAKLKQKTSVSAACLQFIALTAARRSEATEATWQEIDLEARTWTIPSSRMKGGKEHRVPLSNAAVPVLTAMAAIRQSDYVFPSHVPGRPVHGASVTGIAKRVAAADITLHGFRSSFRDWAAERSNFPHEVAEMALAHAIPSAVEKAYRRGDLFEKRRRLMDAWAEFCGKPQGTPKVVAIRQKMADKRKPSFPPSLNKIPGMGPAEFDEKISREQLEQILRNLPLQNEEKDKVEDCASYLYDTFLLAKAAVREKKKDGLASPAGVARQSKYIQKGSITLLNRLKDADRNTFEASADTSDLERHEATQERLQLKRLLQTEAERAEQAARAAEIVAKFLPDGAKRGRRPDVVADVVTVIAAKVYETLTGKYAQRSADRDSRKPYGSFHDFLTQVFQALGISSSPDACNMRLQDQLRHLRKSV